MINAWHRSSEMNKRADEIPASVRAATPDRQRRYPKAFRSGRTSRPGSGRAKQHSSGGKDKLGSMSKEGDRYPRSLFTAGALAVIRYAKVHGPNIGLGSQRRWPGAEITSLPSCCNKSMHGLGMMAKGERDKNVVLAA